MLIQLIFWESYSLVLLAFMIMADKEFISVVFVIWKNLSHIYVHHYYLEIDI